MYNHVCNAYTYAMHNTCLFKKYVYAFNAEIMNFNVTRRKSVSSAYIVEYLYVLLVDRQVLTCLLPKRLIKTLPKK